MYRYHKCFPQIVWIKIKYHTHVKQVGYTSRFLIFTFLGTCKKSIFKFPFWVNFCPFTLLACLKNKTFEKKTTATTAKLPKHITILHQCLKNYDHSTLGCRDMAQDKQMNYFGPTFVIYCCWGFKN